MKDQLTVFYTASFYGKAKYQSFYDLVRKTIEEFHVELISPEAGNYQSILPEATRKKLKDPSRVHYEAIKEGIRKSDAVIIEMSHEDIQLGHEATLALIEKKPVLCLSIHEDMSHKIKHDFFFGSKYSESTLKPTIQDFLAKVRELSLSQRFNLFLYPQQVEYIEQAAKKAGVTKSEYIRLLINRDRATS